MHAGYSFSCMRGKGGGECEGFKEGLILTNSMMYSTASTVCMPGAGRVACEGRDDGDDEADGEMDPTWAWCVIMPIVLLYAMILVEHAVGDGRSFGDFAARGPRELLEHDVGRCTRSSSSKEKKRRGARAQLAARLHIWVNKIAIEGLRVGRSRVTRRRGRIGPARAMRLGKPDDWECRWRPWTKERHVARDTEDDVHALEADTGMPEENGCDWRRHAKPRPIITAAEKGEVAPSGSRVHRRYGRAELEVKLPGRGSVQRRLRTPRKKVAIAAILIAALLGTRVGEAANPGYGLLDPARPRISKVEGEPRRSIYAKPDQIGFHGALSPGFEEDVEALGHVKEDEGAGLVF